MAMKAKTSRRKAKNAPEDIKLSIIVPCYNEAKNIPLLLERFNDCIKTSTGKIKITCDGIDEKEIELILVNNNSKDDTEQILQKELKKYSFARTVFEGTPGYGAAVMRGLRTAKGKYLCWTHGDIQTPPKDTFQAYRILKQAESRGIKAYVKGKRYGRPLVDRFFTIGMAVFESALLKSYMWDINAQPNMFPRELLKNITNPPTDFSLDLFMYYIARRSGYPVIRFPVHFGKRIHGESSWNSGMKARIKFIRRTLDFSFRLKDKLSSEMRQSNDITEKKTNAERKGGEGGQNKHGVNNV